MDSKTLGLLVLAAVLLFLYLMRRRSRLGRMDD
jgi:hypothetical protein